MFILQLVLIICFVTSLWAQDEGWEKKWKETLEEARKEGRVVVNGPADPVLRQKLPARFKKKFGVAVEWISGQGSSTTAQRLLTERRVGITTVDVFFAGIQTMSTILYRRKVLDPIKPVLILPEVVDPSKWKAGKLWFVDPDEKYILRLVNNVSSLLAINTKYVKPEQFRSIKDLINPRWKGKIAVDDPTVPGGGSNKAAILYLQFGEEFIKKLYIDQKPGFSRNRRQIADWLARGTYFISPGGVGGSAIKRLQDEGFPVKSIYRLADASGSLSAGSGGLIALVNNAPHPNAARVFVNWVASKEGLELMARAQLNATTRNDIDESFLSKEQIPVPGVNYFDSYGWEFTVTHKEKARLRIKELLRSR